MATQIINGSVADVKSQVAYVMFIDATGKDMATGVQVISGPLSAIKSQCALALIIDANGNSL